MNKNPAEFHDFFLKFLEFSTFTEFLDYFFVILENFGIERKIIFLRKGEQFHEFSISKNLYPEKRERKLSFSRKRAGKYLNFLLDGKIHLIGSEKISRLIKAFPILSDFRMQSFYLAGFKFNNELESIVAFDRYCSRKKFSVPQLLKLQTFFDVFRLAFEKNMMIEILNERKHQSSIELSTVLDGIAEGIIITDFDNRILHINEQAVRLFDPSKSPLSFQGKPFNEIVGIEELEGLIFHTFNNPEKVLEKEIILNLPNRGRIFLLSKTRIMEDSLGDPIGVVTVLRDTTMEKELEEEKNFFISCISHELRTPLTSIKGYISLILMERFGKLPEEYRNFSGVILRQCNNLIRLINNILDASRLQSNDLRLEYELINFPEFLRQLSENFKSLALEKKISVSEEFSTPLTEFVCDREKLESIFVNLVGNAIKFSPEGSKVVIKVLRRDEGKLFFSVRDFGCGIPDKYREKIFRKFYQIETGLNKSAKGTGLGLYIVHDIITKMGGQIWLESRVGVGSEFFFTLRDIKIEDIPKEGD
ncbi:MAG: ATP-binding protein [Candidatus Wallbacteria bacterium]|nr:ATP-binding protein [Candidatus Wallbacteria bacterium]